MAEKDRDINNEGAGDTASLGSIRARLEERRQLIENSQEDGIDVKAVKEAAHCEDGDNDLDDAKKKIYGSKKEKTKKIKEARELETNRDTSSAMSTLHPAARSIVDPKALNSSRVEMMKNVMGAMGTMPQEDMIAWYNKVIGEFGPGKDHGVGDVSAKNMASIDSKLGSGPKTKEPMQKLSVKEDLDVILSGTDLSEEFKERTTTLFEAAIAARMSIETARIEEEFVDVLTEEVEALTEQLTSKLDSYLDYVVENWMVENKVAIDSSLRSELTFEFIDGMKKLFAEHYVDVPEDKINVMEAMADKIEVLEGRIEQLVSENTTIKDALIDEACKESIEEASASLTMAQKEKFATLAEGIEVNGDFDEYAKKLAIIKESHFEAKAKKASTNILEESFEGSTSTERTVAVDPDVRSYADAIARTVKPGSMTR